MQRYKIIDLLDGMKMRIVPMGYILQRFSIAILQWNPLQNFCEIKVKLLHLGIIFGIEIGSESESTLLDYCC